MLQELMINLNLIKKELVVPMPEGKILCGVKREC